ncbi:MAG: hypothetical protein CMJ78_25160 [Planctomycetaceae bacterium]|nr:hypothetical protein [Planctomycetaceae bacterium]
MRIHQEIFHFENQKSPIAFTSRENYSLKPRTIVPAPSSGATVRSCWQTKKPGFWPQIGLLS